MNNNNKMSTTLYAITHLYMLFLGVYVFMRTVFCCVLETYTASRILFWGIALVTVVLGFAITYKKRRNTLSIFVTLMIPFEIYLILAYGSYYKMWLLVSLIISLILAGCYCSLMVHHAKNNKAFTPGNCAVFCLLGIRTILSVCFSVFVFMLIGKCAADSSLVPVSVQAVTGSRSEEYTLAYNAETLQKLDESIWCTLNETEKMDVLQVVANVERNYFGLSHELNVHAEVLPEDTFGTYNHGAHIIAVSVECLKNDPAAKVLNVLTHECFHAYQHALVDNIYTLPVSDETRELLLFRDLYEYDNDFRTQEEVEDIWSYIDYLSSYSEYDARRYAESAVEDYYEELGLTLDDY